MTSIRLGKLNTSAVASEIFADKTFQAELRAGLDAARGRIGKATVRAFNRTQVGKGLSTNAYNGDSESDIKAHLGFDNSTGNDAAEAIREVIQEALKVAPFRKDRNVIRIRVSYDNLGDFIKENSQFVSYTSDGGEVNWLEWLIDGGGVSYAILFSTNGKFTSISRSERAIMVTKTRLPPWDIDDYGRFAENGTFIEDIFNDERWREDVQEILDKEVVKALGRI
jgi:hypothetical protein